MGGLEVAMHSEFQFFLVIIILDLYIFMGLVLQVVNLSCRLVTKVLNKSAAESNRLV